MTESAHSPHYSEAQRLMRQARSNPDPGVATAEAGLATAAAVLALVDVMNQSATKEKGTREGTPTPELTVYRASHESIVMGLYTTPAEARAHCVAEERRTWAASAAPVFNWIEDTEDDGVAELVTVAEDGETETLTGYIVTALEVASRYDEGADA